MTIYTTLKNGWTTCSGGVIFTGDAGLWDASSPYLCGRKFSTAKEKGLGFIPISSHSMGDVLIHRKPADLMISRMPLKVTMGPRTSRTVGRIFGCLAVLTEVWEILSLTRMDQYLKTHNESDMSRFIFLLKSLCLSLQFWSCSQVSVYTVPILSLACYPRQ